MLALLAVALIGVSAFRSHRDLERWLGEDPYRARRFGRAMLLAAAVTATAVALFRASAEPPKLGGAATDMVILLDVSRSMDAPDTPPSRLRRAVRFAERVMQQTEGVRVGLVLFAGEAFAALPLTQDRDALFTYLLGIDTELISKPGTDLGRALRVSAGVFDPASGNPRTVLLLSDGEQAGTGLDGALQDLRSRRIRVGVVGFGTPGGAIVPGPGADPLQDDQGQPVRSRRVDSTLTRIAADTGGRFWVEAEGLPEPADLFPPAEAARTEEKDRPTPPLPVWALVAAIALAVETFLSSPSKRQRRRWTAAIGTTVAALALLAAGSQSWIREGDTRLEQGDPREALSFYRRVERTRGPSAATQIRVGSALYRLGQHGAASAAFFEALRQGAPEDREARFVAAFNLGTTLLAQEQYREARDALWTALVANPDPLEAKFNYEWAVERIEPDEEFPTAGTPSERENDSFNKEGNEPAPSPGSSTGRAERQPKAARLTEQEAERWLRSIEEDPIEPLREQIRDRFEPGRRRAPGGQSW
jgi:hypothetical protein